MTERLFRDYDLREEMEARRRRLRFVKSVMTRAAAKSGVGSGTLRVGSPANINAPSVAGCSTRMVPRSRSGSVTFRSGFDDEY